MKKGKIILKKVGLWLKEKSPNILMGLGVIGVGVTVVEACKATLKIQDEFGKNLEVITEIKNGKENYPEEEYRKDLTQAYIDTGKTVIKYYWKPVVTGIVSVTCVGSSHYILSKRLESWIAAYGVLFHDFTEYRKKVIADHGREADSNYIRAVKDQRLKSQEYRGPQDAYSRLWDPSSSKWDESPQYRLEFLYHALDYWNYKLFDRGYVILNEVLEFFDIPTIDEDYRWDLGWVCPPGFDPTTMRHIDFGLFDISNGSVRDFINGYEEAIWLNFNVDGRVTDWLWTDSVSHDGTWRFRIGGK